MPTPPDDARFLVPRSQEEPSDAVGQPRGEEFDLSQLEKLSETPPALNSKWNRAWLALAGVLAAYCFYFWVYGLGVRAQRPMPLGPVTAKTAVSRVKVHVAGAVKKPGVYALEADARVFDALQKAGGATANANPNALNLAAFLEDGSKIEVPLKTLPTPQPTPTPVVIVKEVPLPAPASAPSALSSQRATSFEDTSSPSPEKAAAPVERKPKDEGELKRHPVNLNTATLDELQRLPGVGPKMAERIIAFRQENGRFKAISDLDNVKGIGEKRMEKLGPLVVVR